MKKSKKIPTKNHAYRFRIERDGEQMVTSYKLQSIYYNELKYIQNLLNTKTDSQLYFKIGEQDIIFTYLRKVSLHQTLMFILNFRRKFDPEFDYFDPSSKTFDVGTKTIKESIGYVGSRFRQANEEIKKKRLSDSKFANELIELTKLTPNEYEKKYQKFHHNKNTINFKKLTKKEREKIVKDLKSNILSWEKKQKICSDNIKFNKGMLDYFEKLGN